MRRRDAREYEQLITVDEKMKFLRCHGDFPELRGESWSTPQSLIEKRDNAFQEITENLWLKELDYI